MSVEGIPIWLEHSETDDVLSALIALTETDRAALGPPAREWVMKADWNGVERIHASLAILATAGGWRQAMLVPQWLRSDPVFAKNAVAILQARSPAWLPDYVRALLRTEDHFDWRLVRGLVRAGVVPRPDDPAYFRGTAFGLPAYELQDPHSIAERLRAEPDLEGEYLYAMLSTEGVGLQLAYSDAYCKGVWRSTILEFIEHERLDRARVLDTVLAAPLRDWPPRDLKWFIGLHDALEPTLDEIGERQSTYARLLTAEFGPAVMAAQRVFSRFLGDRRFDPAAVLAASTATLGRIDKATVAAQLKLLEKIAEACPGVAVAETVRIAVDHPRANIREQATALLGRLGEPADDLKRSFDAPAPEPWQVEQDVEPIGSVNELGETLLALMDKGDPIDLERSIDGLLRYADKLPKVVKLLWARVDQLTYGGVPHLAARLTWAWLAAHGAWGGRVWDLEYSRRSPSADAATAPVTFVDAISRRLNAIAFAIRQGTWPTLALPNRVDGSIDADVLTERLGSLRDGAALEFEIATALLRVQPADRGKVVLPTSIRGMQAVGQVLAIAPAWERRVVPYWVEFWSGTRLVPAFRDTVGPRLDALSGIAPVSRSDPIADVAAGTIQDEQVLAFGAAMLPHEPEVLAAHAQATLTLGIGDKLAVTAPLFDSLGRSRTKNGAPASSALVLGMATTDRRVRTAAQDAVIDLARHGVLDGAELGRQAALLLEEDFVIGRRVSSGLAEVARASDAAVLPLLDTLDALMGALPGRRDAAPFVDLAADLVDRTGRTVRVPPEFRQLAEGRSTSELARATRRLLRD